MLVASALVAFAAVATRATGQSSRAQADRVWELPGIDNSRVCFRHFSGYLPTASADRHLFYWYVESSESPESKPVVLWLNGGPGCSSLGGLWTENGPFVAHADGSVSLNPYSWNKVANMLYFEMPAGVGFSYPAQYANDTITTQDTHTAIAAFLHDYNLHTHSVFITGESYGGHYVPNLVEAILKGNVAGGPKINLVGFAVGNAFTDWHLDFSANVPYARYHALCSPDALASVQAECGDFSARCFWPRADVPCPPACASAVEKATQYAQDLDIYDIYADVCPKPSQARVASQAFVLEQYRHKYRSQGTNPVSPIYPTCAVSFMQNYLSREDVQRAIHAKRIKGWSQCGIVNGASEPIQYDFSFESMLPKYKTWTANATLKILVFSGDADFILNFMGTQSWIETLRLPVRREFHSWHGSDGQVGGYVTDYEGLTFATIKGAGHMAAQDRPLHALDMVTAFLTGESLGDIAPSRNSPLCPEVVLQYM